MDSKLAPYLTAAVPRYTSYPTAPHFDSSVDGRALFGWLAQLESREAVSLYLHVPFCQQACWYCGCNMKLVARYGPVADYVNCLLKEIDLVAGHLPGRFKIGHLHWGGGTPTSLEPDDLERVMAEVRARFDFTDDAEVAIESDPRTLTPEMITRLGALGFNRASFGVQEFDPKVQAAINRVQPPDLVEAAVEALRTAGVKAINFDLIYGLPHQTTATLLKTIDLCMAMQPDRLALFGYAHVPWMAKKQRMIEQASLPGAEERLRQAQTAADALRTRGYKQVGLDHFAKPDDPLARAASDGRLRRNFQGYTTDAAQTLIGVGATSIGRTPFGYVQNAVETGAWSAALDKGELPVAKGIAFSGDDKLRGEIIELLMCGREVDLNEIGRRYGVAPGFWAEEQRALAPLQDDGLVHVDAGKLTITERGAPFVRVIAAVFDAYRSRGAARHSAAV